MTTFPAQGFYNGPVIMPWSLDSCGVSILGPGTVLPTIAGTITQNQAYYVPFVILNKPYTVLRMFVYTSTTGTGNIDVGIYDSQGNRLVSMGSTAHGAAAVLQFFDITDTTLQPGMYWMGMASNSATDTFLRGATSELFLRGYYVRQQASAFALPNPATFAVPTSAFLPIFGVTNRTF